MASYGEGHVADREKDEGRPRILGVSLPSQLAERLRAVCARRGWDWLPLQRTGLPAEMLSKQADVVVIVGGEEGRRGQQENWTGKIPTLVIDLEGSHRKADAVQIGDRHVSISADDDSLSAALDEILRNRGTLEFALQRIDAQSRRVACNDDSEWVRSRFGIVGVVWLSIARSGPELKDKIGLAVRKAYALLDALSDEQLSLVDLWNLLLFVSVPWTQAEAESDQELMEVLDETVRDTSGSRKLILWKGRSLMDHLGPMGRRGTLWLPSSPDPLRDALQAAVRDELELDALEAIFKARITEVDLDHIVKVLSRSIG